MPNRGHRAAARRGQLSQKRKKGRGPSGIPTTPPQDGDGRDQSVIAPRPVTTAVAETRPSVAPSRRTETRSVVYKHVGAELRRILLLSGTIIAVVVVLSFFLD